MADSPEKRLFRSPRGRGAKFHCKTPTHLPKGRFVPAFLATWREIVSLFQRSSYLYVLLLPLLACVRFEAALPPPAIVAPPAPPTPTPIVWPTFSPRPTPLALPAAPVPAQPACRWPELPAGQHLSASGSYTVTESVTVGWMQCHITRDSCAYNLLVGRLDPTIVFKREETAPFDVEDLVMHPALVQPLSRLNALVQSEWDGAVQLRITDAYDSLLSHDPPGSEPKSRYSLHYEGRALDLTTWPVDRRLYGRLCSLALCAGFDWVHNEGSHCHASIAAPSLCDQC